MRENAHVPRVVQGMKNGVVGVNAERRSRSQPPQQRHGALNVALFVYRCCYGAYMRHTYGMSLRMAQRSTRAGARWKRGGEAVTPDRDARDSRTVRFTFGRYEENEWLRPSADSTQRGELIW